MSVQIPHHPSCDSDVLWKFHKGIVFPILADILVQAAKGRGAARRAAEGCGDGG
jgi:hypothetical protein